MRRDTTASLTTWTLVVGLAASGWAAQAHAQVAVVPAIAERDVAQRELVAAVVQAVAERWDLLSPQLDAAAMAGCAKKDVPCLQGLARSRGASHLLVVGAGTLTLRDQLVSVRLFDLNAPEPLFKESVRQTGSEAAPEALLTLVRSRLLEVRGPPPARLAPPVPEPEPAPREDTLALALLASGAAALGVCAAVALPLAAEQPAPALAVGAGGSVAAIALSALGSALLVRGLD